MISIDEALRRVLTEARPLGEEEVPLDEAPGRFLATSLAARWDLPPFDNSAMDGYALRAEDVKGGSRALPARLRVVERLFAGSRAGRALGPGEAARIMTGAPVPPGADAVIRQEATSAEGEQVSVFSPVERGENVRRKGEDAKEGELLLEPGRLVDAAAIPLLASFGCERVRVGRRPRVALLATGDELAPVEEAAPGRVVDSNSHVLLALAREVGAVAWRIGIAPDEPAEVARCLAGARDGADLLVTAAGASVGERDPVRAALDSLGVEIRFWKVAIKPGKPVGFGRLGDKLVFALPGNPASAAMTFELLVRPALLALQGARELGRPRLRARLQAEVEKQPDLTYFLRGQLGWGEGGLRISVPARQGSGQLTPALQANAVAVLPSGRSRFTAGEEVEVLLMGPMPSQGGMPVSTENPICHEGG